MDSSRNPVTPPRHEGVHGVGPGGEDDGDLGAIAIGWLTSDPVALGEVADRLMDRVVECPLDRMSDDQLRSVAARWETAATRVQAVRADLAAEIDRRGHDRESGFFSTRAVIEHRHRLSRASSPERTQTMRMFELLPAWTAAARDGTVGADQVALIARVAASPRITDALIDGAADLLDDARRLSFRRFEERVRTFVKLADRDGTRSVDERSCDRRHVTLRQLRDGSWRLTGRFPALMGAQINDTFAHFVDAEFHTDIADARARADGAEPDWGDLARTEPQRRAAACHAICRSAASAPHGRSTPLPTLNVLFDAQSLRSVLDDEPIDPAHYRQVICRTQRGDDVALDEAAATTLWAHVRRVVTDGAGTIIDLGRRRRLFRGSSRDAALLLHDTCAWPGCTVHSVDCEADHARTWHTHGTTDPDNGLPLCKRHNLHKHTGRFTAHRDATGDWTIHHPDGTPVD